MPDHQVNPPLVASRKTAYDAAVADVAAVTEELRLAREARDFARTQLLWAIEAVQRTDNLTWKEIGEQMGVTAQAASQFYKRWSGRG